MIFLKLSKYEERLTPIKTQFYYKVSQETQLLLSGITGSLTVVLCHKYLINYIIFSILFLPVYNWLIAPVM